MPQGRPVGLPCVLVLRGPDWETPAGAALPTLRGLLFGVSVYLHRASSIHKNLNTCPERQLVLHLSPRGTPEGPAPGSAPALTSCGAPLKTLADW